ncbi:MAG: hypothetical protein ACI9BF_000766 [Candidatus Paceibacteria bacterium]
MRDISSQLSFLHPQKLCCLLNSYLRTVTSPQKIYSFQSLFSGLATPPQRLSVSRTGASGSGAKVTKIPVLRLEFFQNGFLRNYFNVTLAPASSSLVFKASASSFFTFSFTTAGAPSTISLASLRPSPRTSLIALITAIF